MGQSLKHESVRMRSTIQSLISSVRMIPTMPTTVTRSMNLKRAKHKNHLPRCLRLCNRQCNRPSSSPKKYDGLVFVVFIPIYYEWWILCCIVFSIGAVSGDSRDHRPQRTTSWIWVHCRSTIYIGVWPRCCQAHCPVCCSQRPPVSHSAHAERTEELPVWLSAPTAQSLQLFHQTCGAVH